jgi:hypothetical protein
MNVSAAKIRLEGVSSSIIRELRLLSGRSISADVLRNGKAGDLVMLRIAGKILEARLEGIAVQMGQKLKLHVGEFSEGRLVLRLQDPRAAVDSKMNFAHSLPFPMKASFVEAFFTFIRSVIDPVSQDSSRKKTDKPEWVDLLRSGGMNVEGALGIDDLILPVSDDDGRGARKALRMAVGSIDNRRIVVLRIPTLSLGEIGVLISMAGEDQGAIAITLWSENDKSMEAIQGELKGWKAALREYLPGLDKIQILRKEELGEFETGRQWIS